MRPILNFQSSILNFQAAVISVICVFMCASPAAQAKLPRAAELIPPDTILLLEIDDFNQLQQQFEKTSFYELYKEPAMAAFFDDFKTKWRQKLNKLNNWLGKMVLDEEVLPQGRVAVCLVLNQQVIDANDPPLIFITQWGGNIDKIKQAVQKTVSEAVADGAHQSSEEYRGVSIKKIISKNSAMLGYFFLDDCMIGSIYPELLKFVIAQLKGSSSPSLNDDTAYIATMKTTGPYHDIDLYINVKQIIKIISAEDATGKARTNITNLGLENVGAFGCSVGIGRCPGSSWCGKSFLKIDGEKKGILKMLEFESGVLKAPRFIPASAYSAAFLNLDIKKAYNELYKILYNFSPVYAGMMHTPLLEPGPDGKPPLELKTDVIDHLGSQVIIAQSMNKPFSSSGSLPPTESLIALAVSNPGALERSISLVYNQAILPNNPDAVRELLGHRIYLVNIQALPFLPTGVTPMQDAEQPASAQMPKLAFTITQTHLILGLESTVEQAIRILSSSSTVSMASAKWFTLAKAAIPSIIGLAGLQDNAASNELLWWMLKESAKAKVSSTLQIGPQKLNELFNPSLLPEFDTVRKYFGVSAFYGIARPDGLFFEFKYLNPTGAE